MTSERGDQHQQGRLRQVEVGQQRVDDLERSTGIQEQVRHAASGAHTASAVGAGLECTAAGGADRDHATATCLGRSDLVGRRLRQFVDLLMHAVLLDVLDSHRRERAFTDVQGHERAFDACRLQAFEQRRREVQPRGRGRDGAGDPREHGLVAFAIVGDVLVVRTRDVRRQRRPATPFEFVGNRTVGCLQAHTPAATAEAGFEFGTQSPPFELQPITGPQPTARLHEGLADLLGGVEPHQQALDRSAGPGPLATEPPRHHTRVVEHQQVALAKQPGQISHVLMRRRSPRTIVHQEPRRVARLDRARGDAICRQVEVEVRDAHAERLSNARVEAPARTAAVAARNLAEHDRRMVREDAASRTLAPVAVALLLGACSPGGSGGSGPLNVQVEPQLIVGRARVDQPHRFAEIALRDVRNLGTDRVGDRVGRELNTRLHPDRRQVVFARERVANDPDSRELFASTIDGTSAELRLTVRSGRDQDPCWSPNGGRVLFASDREGQLRLFTIEANGTDVQPLLTPPLDAEDDQPDWCWTHDRIVFRRRQTGAPARLWLTDPSGSSAQPLTDGGGAALGDEDPAFSDDGEHVVFVRRDSTDRAVLCLVEVATGAVDIVLDPDGDVAHPDVHHDVVYFGLAQPNVGRQTLRLATVPVAGGEPTLVWPDERWQLTSVDFVRWPQPASTPPTVGPTPVDLERDGSFTVVLASGASGAVSQLVEDDGHEFYLRTSASGDRQVAGLRATLDLRLAEPLDMERVRCTVRMRVSRSGGDSLLRLSLRNPVDGRADTVVELPVDTADEQELTFLTSSLRHLDRDGTFEFHVIADLDSGPPSDVWIDLIACEVTSLAR